MKRKKKKRKIPTHDRIVSFLEEKLKGEDRLVLSEHKYKHYGDHEADILMINKLRRYAYAIEVKTTDSNKARNKAIRQLDSDEKYINDRFNINRVFKFYAFKPNKNSNRNYEIRLI